MRDAATVMAKIAEATARDRILIAAKRGEPMEQAGDQMRALLDAVTALDGASIPYAIIGGIAVGIQSEIPRATQDVDVAISTSVARERVSAVLTAAGFDASGSFAHSVNLRHPSGEPVQLAFDPAFDEMIDRAEIVEIGEHQVRVVRRADLIEMKERAAADPARRKSKALRDRADIELLRGDLPDEDEGW